MLKKLDKLGRVVIPLEYRQALSFKEGNEIQMILKANEIIIKKPIFGCIFCNAAVNLVKVGNLYACRSCIKRLQNLNDKGLL